MKDFSKYYTSKYEKLFNNTNVNYYPFVGNHYDENRILVVGESHYYGEGCTPEERIQIDTNHFHTKECYIEQYPVFRKMQSLLANKVIGAESVSANIAFYNFFQHCVGFSSRDKSLIKKNNLVTEAREAFFMILEILEPKLVIVWGTSAMWEWMPDYDYTMKDKNSYIYNIYPNSLIFHINHPSSNNFDLLENAKIIKNYFEKQGIVYPLPNREISDENQEYRNRKAFRFGR